jgi:chromosome segregation ATPase
MSIHAGKENEKKWEIYWDNLRARGEYLPIKSNGEVNVARVGRDSKIGRENLYKNPNIHPKLLAAIKETLEAQRERDVREDKPEAPASTDRKQNDAAQKKIDARDRRIKELEEKVAVLTAETHELRRRVKALEEEKSRFEFIEDMVAETGRRILPY